jgi:hypothetical protein
VKYERFESGRGGEQGVRKGDQKALLAAAREKLGESAEWSEAAVTTFAAGWGRGEGVQALQLAVEMMWTREPVEAAMKIFERHGVERKSPQAEEGVASKIGADGYAYMREMQGSPTQQVDVTLHESSGVRWPVLTGLVKIGLKEGLPKYLKVEKKKLTEPWTEVKLDQNPAVYRVGRGFAVRVINTASLQVLKLTVTVTPTAFSGVVESVAKTEVIPAGELVPVQMGQRQVLVVENMSCNQGQVGYFRSGGGFEVLRELPKEARVEIAGTYDGPLQLRNGGEAKGRMRWFIRDLPEPIVDTRPRESPTFAEPVPVPQPEGDTEVLGDLTVDLARGKTRTWNGEEVGPHVRPRKRQRPRKAAKTEDDVEPSATANAEGAEIVQSVPQQGVRARWRPAAATKDGTANGERRGDE